MGKCLVSYNHDNVIDKLVKLRGSIHLSPLDNTKDLIWCKRLIDDVKDGGLVPNKQEFIMANLMWKKYSNGVEPTNEDMWELIDGMLTQENPSKIGAIKTYRRFTNSTLKDAKDMVDAREIKIKKGW